MHRAVYFSMMIIIVLLLGACNTKEIDEFQGSRDLLYTHSHELKQNFEGVKLKMTYVVVDTGDKVMLEMTGTLINDFPERVYYTPTFIAEDKNGTQYQSRDVLEISLAPAQELTFTEVIELPADVYAVNDGIRFFVPAAFTQSGSVSSGDALGDTVWWELPLK